MRISLESERRTPVSRPSAHTLKNKLLRQLWGVAWVLLFRPSPKPFHGFRRALLRAFGATIGHSAVVHPSVKIWAPWNLVMHQGACLAPDVDCYCVAPVVIGRFATVSQYSFLCTATHDFSELEMPLMTSPISIEEYAWVCADVFVGPGVTVQSGAVIGARSSVFKSVAPWTVNVGSPARYVGPRVLKK